MEILCKIGPINLMGPEGTEYFISIKSIFKFGIELM